MNHTEGSSHYFCCYENWTITHQIYLSCVLFSFCDILIFISIGNTPTSLTPIHGNNERQIKDVRMMIILSSFKKRKRVFRMKNDEVDDFYGDGKYLTFDEMMMFGKIFTFGWLSILFSWCLGWIWIYFTWVLPILLLRGR